MVRISHGPIPVTVASGKEIMASGEWGALIPLADNSFQAVRELSMEKVVGQMPDYKLRPVLAEMKKGAVDNKLLQSMKIPAKLGGEIEVLLSIRYLRIMLKPVHQLPCGLTVYQYVLKPFKDREKAVIGGTLQAFNSITKHFDKRDVIKHMVSLCSSIKNFELKIEYFPSERFGKMAP